MGLAPVGNAVFTRGYQMGGDWSPSEHAVLRRSVGGLEAFSPTESIGKMSGAEASQALCSLGANRSSWSLPVCSLHQSNGQGSPVLFTIEKHFHYI